MEKPDATYTSTLSVLGDAETAKPSAIHFYAKDFESKDMIEAFIEDYNESVEEVDQLKYTDLVKTLMSSVTTIVNAISSVLIGNSYLRCAWSQWSHCGEDEERLGRQGKGECQG